jgi:hypothetical protein
MAQPASPTGVALAECTNKYIGMLTARRQDLEGGSCGLLKALFMHSPGEIKKDCGFLVALEVCGSSLEMAWSIFFVYCL